MNRDRWGNKYDEGLSFLVAHTMVIMGVVTGSASASPKIASKTVGPVSIAYATAPGSGSESDYEDTTYGQMYLRKLRTLVRAPLVL